MQTAPSFSLFPSVQNLRALMPNVSAHRPRATEIRLGIETQSWFAFGSRPVPWVDALGLVFLPVCAGFGSLTVHV